ncbi:type-2 angiotensin II receptor-like [Betta splendens]|uniref:Type-2 angiotensin II receptor-like n=1 Tax=Betta splendens TaxID=158456 RepID=A0A6P7NMR0_BETSP|nr:type-2 angiotensin II receptor-like [Betta splendens]
MVAHDLPLPNATTNLSSAAPGCADWPPVAMTTAIPAVYGVVCVLGAAANALAACVLARGAASRRTVANTFMLNLCVSDLLFLLSLPLWAVYYARGYRWPFGWLACKACGALLNLNLYASIFFITCMSMDRYLAIVHPLRSQGLRDPKRARLTCQVVWVLACACSAPNVAFRTTQYLPDLGVEACVISYPDHQWYVALNCMKMVLGFLLPLAVICFCYGAIGRHLWVWADADVFGTRAPSEPPRGPSAEPRESCGRPERPPAPCAGPSCSTGRSLEGRGLERILWTVAAVVLAFFLCWFPFHCVTLLAVLMHEGWLEGCWVMWATHNLTPLTLCLGFSNSAINPLLYCFVGNHFRGRLGGLCRGLRARGERQSQKRGSFSTRLSSFSRKLSDLKDLVIVEPTSPA